jgi:hypothetical protein
MNGMTMPIRASASVSAKPMYMFDRVGLAGHGLDAVAEDQADAYAGANGREAVAHRAEVDDQPGGCRGGQYVCDVKHLRIPLR